MIRKHGYESGDRPSPLPPVRDPQAPGTADRGRGGIRYDLWRSETGEPPLRVAGCLVTTQFLDDAAIDPRPWVVRALVEQVPAHLLTSGHWECSEATDVSGPDWFNDGHALSSS